LRHSFRREAPEEIGQQILLPLLAITVNSPIAGDRDTGWASSRCPAWL
jgi:hypothetical protein